MAGEPQGGVDIVPADDDVVVSFWGVVDVTLRGDAAAGLWEARIPGRRLTVDCTRVTHMDSIGLSVLVRLVRDATGEGQQVRFGGGSDQVRELLESTGTRAWMVNLGVSFTG